VFTKHTGERMSEMSLVNKILSSNDTVLVTSSIRYSQNKDVSYTFPALSISTDGRRKASAISLRKVGYFLP